MFRFASLQSTGSGSSRGGGRSRSGDPRDEAGRRAPNGPTNNRKRRHFAVTSQRQRRARPRPAVLELAHGWTTGQRSSCRETCDESVVIDAVTDGPRVWHPSVRACTQRPLPTDCSMLSALAGRCHFWAYISWISRLLASCDNSTCPSRAVPVHGDDCRRNREQPIDRRIAQVVCAHACGFDHERPPIFDQRKLTRNGGFIFLGRVIYHQYTVALLTNKTATAPVPVTTGWHWQLRQRGGERMATPVTNKTQGTDPSTEIAVECQSCVHTTTRDLASRPAMHCPPAGWRLRAVLARWPYLRHDPLLFHTLHSRGHYRTCARARTSTTTRLRSVDRALQLHATTTHAARAIELAGCWRGKALLCRKEHGYRLLARQ